MSIGSAAFTVTSSFDNAQIQASVDRLNATVAASIKDARIGSELDQAKLDATLKAATVKIARTQANVKLGADMQTAQIDATIAKAKADILAQSETIGTDSGKEMQSGFEGFMSPQVLIPAITAATALLPGLFAVAGSAGAIALGAAFAIKASPELQKQGAALVSGLETTVENAASVLDKPIEQAFTELKGDLPTLQRLLGTTFSDVGPEIKPFATMLTEIVNDTMPGFNTLMSDAEGPLSAFFVNTGKIVGTGLDRFFTALGPGVSASLTDLDGLLSVMMQLLPVIAHVSSEIAGIPGLLGKLGSSLNAENTPLANLGKSLHIPDSGDNIFQALPKFFSWMGKVMPGGNKTILDLAEGTSSASSGIKSTGDNAAAAAPKVGTLAGDMGVLNTNTGGAANALNAFNDMWQILVGKSLSDQQAILADQSAFESLQQSIKTSGASSTQARQAFVTYMQAIGTSLSTLQQNGASVGQVNSAYATNIKNLESLHNLTPTQKQDIAGLIKDYDTWANSTSGLNTQTELAVKALGSDFNGQLAILGKNIPGINTAVSNFADSILKTGDNSKSTAGDRAALITDLEKAGVSATTAKQLVNTLQQQIDALKGKTVDVGANTSKATAAVDSFQAMVDSLHGKTVTIGTQVIGASTLTTGMLNGIGMADGGIVHAANGLTVRGRGPSGRDSVLAMLAPGELVIPTSHAPKFRDAARKASIPGFAGGYVGEPVFRTGTMPYSFAEPAPVVAASASVPAGGLPMTRTQGAALLQKLDRLIQQNAQAPYTMSQALNQANGNGVRRGYFSPV